MKKIAIFGCSGSIGTQAIDFIAAHGEKFKADVLVAHSNIDLLIKQAKEFRPSAIGLINEAAYDKEKFACLNGIKVAIGKEAYDLCLSADEILFSAVGADVLSALMLYVNAGKTIALANKECLVSAGELITDAAKKHEAKIIPVDSEHSAVWQCLRAGNRRDVQEIILTASGGRYYGSDEKTLQSVTPAQAAVHPNWKMGKKISVDSATMMNKAFELIEARWLFDTCNVDYVIHPQSLIHSMVRFNDGSVFAQMSEPDMRLPISVALSYPDRIDCGVKDFKFDRPLTFLPKREDVFFAPKLARYCIKNGGSSGAIMDAADQAAVELFMQGKIAFTDIANIVKDQLDKTDARQNLSLGGIIELREEVKNRVLSLY